MKISSIELKQFKRFTHLKIEDIPESARLVVILGSNGSGKSSLFEALTCYFQEQRARQHSIKAIMLR